MEHVASQKTTQAKITPMEDDEPSLEVATVSSVNSFCNFWGCSSFVVFGDVDIEKGQDKNDKVGLN
jgi:hypothetical protein